MNCSLVRIRPLFRHALERKLPPPSPLPIGKAFSRAVPPLAKLQQ